MQSFSMRTREYLIFFFFHGDNSIVHKKCLCNGNWIDSDTFLNFHSGENTYVTRIGFFFFFLVDEIQ